MLLSWDDPSTRKAIDIYMRTVNPMRRGAPGTSSSSVASTPDSVDDVYIVFDANYPVHGLGDVYLGAPVATPVDPRHRLVTTKYNPWTWTPRTPSASVSTLYLRHGGTGRLPVRRSHGPVLNTFPRSDCFADGKPGCCVSSISCASIPWKPTSCCNCARIPGRTWQPRIDPVDLLAEQAEFARDNAEDIERQRRRQQAAFAAERGRWARRAGMNIDESGGGAIGSAIGAHPEARDQIAAAASVAIHLLDDDALQRRVAALDPDAPLFGVPFVIKDNLDLAGHPTTAACPVMPMSPRNRPRRRAPGSGGRGLRRQGQPRPVRDRSGPNALAYGVPTNAVLPDRVPGGSSSGSAVAVALGIVPSLWGPIPRAWDVFRRRQHRRSPRRRAASVREASCRLVAASIASASSRVPPPMRQESAIMGAAVGRSARPSQPTPGPISRIGRLTGDDLVIDDPVYGDGYERFLDLIAGDGCSSTRSITAPSPKPRICSTADRGWPNAPRRSAMRSLGDR